MIYFLFYFTWKLRTHIFNVFKRFSLREISIIVNMLFIVIFVFCLRYPCSVVVVACFFVYPYFCTALCCCLFCFLIPFFILMLLLYFCLFIDHVNKLYIFVFGAFVYHFKNTISIFVKIFYFYLSKHFSLRFTTL